MVTDNKTRVRPLTFEEMTESQREAVRRSLAPRRRRSGLPEAEHEYDVLAAYDEQVNSCHREKKPR